MPKPGRGSGILNAHHGSLLDRADNATVRATQLGSLNMRNRPLRATFGPAPERRKARSAAPCREWLADTIVFVRCTTSSRRLRRDCCASPATRPG